MSDLRIGASLGTYSNCVEEPQSVQEDAPPPPLALLTTNFTSLPLASTGQPLSPLRAGLQHFRQDHLQDGPSLLDDLKAWPAFLNQEDAAFRFVCFNWPESLKAALSHKLFQSLTTVQLQTLYQEMYQKIREELHSRLPLSDRLTELALSPCKEAIESALQSHLKIWLKDLVEEQIVHLFPALLHSLFPGSLPQDPTPYERFLTFMLQNLSSCQEFIKRFVNSQKRWKNAKSIDISRDPDVQHLIEGWLQWPYRRDYLHYSPLWVQASSQDLFSLIPNGKDPVQWNRKMCQRELLLLLIEIFPGGPLEILREGVLMKMNQNLFRPSYVRHRKKTDQKLRECQHEFRQTLCDSLRQRIRPEMSSEEFLKWVLNQTQHFFQNWTQNLLQDLHSTVQRHLQTPYSFLPLVLDFQSVIAPNPDWPDDRIHQAFSPYTPTTHSTDPSTPTTHSTDPPTPTLHLSRLTDPNTIGLAT